jgi:hypothetical protein
MEEELEKLAAATGRSKTNNGRPPSSDTPCARGITAYAGSESLYGERPDDPATCRLRLRMLLMFITKARLGPTA